MALFWLELGRLPPNGIAPMLHCRVLDLPSVHDKATMTVILEDLQKRQTFPLSSADQQTLLDWAENAAIMDFAFSEFRRAPSGSNMSAVWGMLSTGKLMVEVRQTNPSIFSYFLNFELLSRYACVTTWQTVNEWGVILRDLDPSTRRKILGLAFATEGLTLSDLPLELIGLQRMLQNLLIPVHAGSKKLMFATSFHRGAMQARPDQK